jgi:hypothetical protein
MRANSAWGFLGLSFVFWSLRFSMIWTTGHEEYGSYLVWAGVVCFVASISCFVWPWFTRNRSSTSSEAVTATAHSSISANQSGGLSFQGERNNYTIVAGTTSSRFNTADTKPSKDKSEIALVFGREGPYVETSSFNSVNVRKTVCVGVKNVGETYLSNCKLMFEARRPDNEVSERWLRDGPFSLNAGEERYLSVSAYNEPISEQTAPENWIMLSAPPSGNFWRPPMISAAGGAVTLTATSAESRECRVICKFWAKGGRFYWEEVSGNVLANSVSDPRQRLPELGNDEFVPMQEAATRAYSELRADGSSWAKAADSFAQHGVKEKVYFAGALSGEIPIYGKHPPSRIYEVISPDEFKRGSFKDDGASFHYYGNQNPQFIEIAVKNGDLSRAIEQMRERQKTQTSRN